MYFNNCGTNNVNKTFIIEPFTGESLSACTGVFTNIIQSCSGDTSIQLGSGLVTFNSNVTGVSGFTATTIEATTYFSGGTNILDLINNSNDFVTGGTFNDITDSITLTRSDGANVIITGLTNFFTTATTLINDIVYFDRNDALSAYTLDLTSLDVNDTFITGFTRSGNVLTLERNDDVDLPLDISEIVFSGGSGNCITDLYVTNIFGCSPITLNDIMSVGDSVVTISADTIPSTTLSHDLGNASKRWNNIYGGTIFGDGSNLTNIDNFFVTASTYNNLSNTITYTRNDNVSFQTYIDELSGITITGDLDIQNTIFNTTGDVLIDDNAEVRNNLLVRGDFTVLGTTTTINTSNLLIEDNIIILNSTATGTTEPILNSGIEVLRNSATTSTLLWNEINDQWEGGLSGATEKIILATDGLSDLAFTAHTHPISEINGLQTNLNDKLFVSAHTFTTASTLSNNIAYFDNNQTLSAYTLDLTPLVTLLSGNTFVTSGIFDNSSDTLTLTRNDLGTILITGFTDSFTSGATLIGSTLYFDRNDSLSAYTSDLSSLLDNTDNFTTGSTLIGSTAYFDRSDVLSAYTLDLSSLDVNDTFITGNTWDELTNTFSSIRNDGANVDVFIGGFSGLTVNGILSATTYVGDGSNLTGIPNDFTTGTTLINKIAHFDRTDTLSAYTLDLTTIPAQYSVKSVSSDYTITINDNIIGVDTSSSAITITLPEASIIGERTFWVKDIGISALTNNITIIRSGSDTIIDKLTGQTGTTISINGNALMLSSNGINQYWAIDGAAVEGDVTVNGSLEIIGSTNGIILESDTGDRVKGQIIEVSTDTYTWEFTKL